MNRVEWTVAILRILAIWLVIRVLLGLPALLVRAASGGGSETFLLPPGYRAVELVALSVYLLLAALLWRLARPLASLIWRDRQDVAVADGLSGHNLQTAIFSALGLYVVIDALPALVSALGYLHLRVTELRPDYAYPPDFAPNAVGLLLQIAAGLWLLFWADKLVRRIASSEKSTGEPGTG